MKLWKFINIFVLSTYILSSLFSSMNVLAQETNTIPFVQTKISVAADWWVPFDTATYDHTTITNAGKDASATNWVVRITDFVMYKIEVAVNDAASSGDLIATVLLDPNNTINNNRQTWKSIPDTCVSSGSYISIDKQILVCNLGKYREWTNAIFYAEAIVTQHNRNGDHIQANVSVHTSDWMSNVATDGPTDIITTASFGVDLIKTLKPPYKNASGDIIYIPNQNVHLNGAPWGTWHIITYRITADYAKWSAFVSWNINNEVSYALSDIFQYFSWYLGTWALFAWCVDVWGNIWSLWCPSIGTPLFPTNTSYTFPINLNNINISGAIDDNKVFAIDVKYWIPLADIRPDGVPITNRNSVIFNWWSIVDNNNQPLSQDNIPNYEWSGENLANNQMDYALLRVEPGSWACQISAWWWNITTPKNGAKKVVPWEILDLNIYVGYVWYYLNNETKTFSCMNLDTSSYEFDHIWSPNKLIPYIREYNQREYRAASSYSEGWVHQFDIQQYTIEYAAIPATANTISTSPLRDSTCEDDMNSDWNYDWYLDPNSVPWGKSAITKVRITSKPNYKYLNESYPWIREITNMINIAVKIKNTTIPGTLLPFPIKCAYDEDAQNDPSKRIDTSSLVETNLWSPDSYYFHYLYADRVHVVWSKVWIQKTLNSDTRIFSPWDTINFTITPQLNGNYTPWIHDLWSTGVTITDTLPAYNTLLNWTATCPEWQSITKTSWTWDNPIIWTISWGKIGQPTCTIDYDIKLENNAINYNYTNIARIDICDPNNGEDCGILDKDIDWSGNNTIPIIASAWYSVVSRWTVFDVKKDTPNPIKQINTPFMFDLSYANLGIESFSDARVIDILPYNGDNIMTWTSGPNTSRRPWSNFHGTYQLTNIITTNWEYGFEVTNADPTLISLDASVSNAGVTRTTCSNLSNPSTCLSDITAIRRNVPASALTAWAMRKTLSIQLTPTNNLSGDIYTNSFSAKVPEMSFPVVSNDISVLVVAWAIWDTVWYDTNSDGIQDSNEYGLAWVLVTLKSSTGLLLGTTITDSEGKYIFTWLNAWTYEISINKPESRSNTYDLDSGIITPDAVTLITISETRNAITNAIEWLASNMSWDFGLIWVASSIAGNIYLDNNMSKLFDGFDMWLSWFIVTLQWVDSIGNVIYLTGITDELGHYSFNWLNPGNYSVNYINNSIYTSSVSNTGTIWTGIIWLSLNTQNLTNISLWYGQNSIDNNFGLVSPASIAGSIYHDSWKDRTMDSSDPLLSWQIVFLNGIDILGNAVLFTTITNENWAYIFSWIIPGNYSVTYANTYDNLSPFSSIAWSEWWIETSYQSINNIILNPWENAIAYDFGLIDTINKQTLAGKIYIDENIDNILSAWDIMYNSGAIVILSWIDSSSNIVNISTVAWLDGNYKFTNLNPGIYSVYLDTWSVVQYIHSTTNTGTINGNEIGILDNLILKDIALWIEEDSIDNNFGLTYMDLTVSVDCEPKSWKAGMSVICTIEYSNHGTAISENTIIDLTSLLSWLNIDPSDTQKLIGNLEPWASNSFTINVNISNDNSFVWQQLPIRAHIYSTSTPEKDILPNTDIDYITILDEDKLSIAGNIYIDQNKSDYNDAWDTIYTSWTIIKLTWVDKFGNTINRTTTIWSNWSYIFENLIEWVYSISIEFSDNNFELTTSNAGTINGIYIWVWKTESWTKENINFILLSGHNGINYNFGIITKVVTPVISTPVWWTYNPVPIISTPPIVESSKEIISTQEIIKSIENKLHQSANISVTEINNDEVLVVTKWLSLPKTGVDIY